MSEMMELSGKSEIADWAQAAEGPARTKSMRKTAEVGAFTAQHSPGNPHNETLTVKPTHNIPSSATVQLSHQGKHGGGREGGTISIVLDTPTREEQDRGAVSPLRARHSLRKSE